MIPGLGAAGALAGGGGLSNQESVSQSGRTGDIGGATTTQGGNPYEVARNKVGAFNITSGGGSNTSKGSAGGIEIPWTQLIIGLGVVAVVYILFRNRK